MKKILNVIKENKAFIFPWVILVTLTVVMAFGLTYAYFDYITDSEGESSTRVTATDLHVNLSNPTVNLSTLNPIYDDYKDTQANLFTFSLSNTSRKLDGCVDLYLYFTSISDGFKSADIKWELVNNTLNTITTGNFSNVVDGRLLLKENQNIPINTTYSYTLKIWYSFARNRNQVPASGSVNAKLTSIAYGGACASTKVTTYTSGTNEFTASVDGYYSIETFNANGSYTSGEIFLAIGEKLYATVGNPSDIKCYIDSGTGICGASSGQNANNSRIMYAGTNFASSFVSGLAGVNSPVYVNSSTDLSYNTLHPTGKFFLNGNVKFNTDNTDSKIVITYLGKYNERTNTRLNNVRYIKDCMNGSTANVNNHWVEIQAIKNGVNVAYKKSLSGNSTDQKIVNGIISASESVSVSSGNKCVTVDLGRTYDLDEIAVWHYYTDGRTYNNNITSVSSNNSSWTEVINRQEPETQYGKRVSAYPEKHIISEEELQETNPSFFEYTTTQDYVAVTYDLDKSTCQSYIEAEDYCSGEDLCTQNYCDVFIKDALLNDEIMEEDYESFGLSNVEFYDETIEITGYTGNSVTYDIDVSTCRSYALSSGVVSSSTQANSYCAFGIGSALKTGEIQPSDYANFGLSNVVINNNPNVVIPKMIDGLPVTVIGNDSFQGDILAGSAITSVVIPDTVVYIGESAFASNSLTSVEIPFSVREIHDYAFQGNTLRNVVIKAKENSGDFDDYGTDIWSWDDGYTDSDIVWEWAQ